MIKSIRVKNFRGITEGYYEFGPGVNEIQGPNEIGKSTICEAIAFGLMGTDRSGAANPNHLIQEGKSEAEVIITTRAAAFTRKKKLTATSTVSVERGGIDLGKMTQTELNKLFGYDADVLLSAYHLGYFMRLSDAKKLEVINNIVKVDRKALLEQHISNPSLIPWKLVKLKSPRVDADAVARERRLLQNTLSGQMGALRELTAASVQSQSSISDADIAHAETRIKPLEAQAELCALYRRDLQTYENQLARYEVEAKNYAENVKRAENLQLELNALAPVEPISADWQIQAAELLAHSQAARERKKLTPPPPVSTELPEGSCSKCGQVVPEKLRAQAAHDRDQALIAYNKEAREVADYNNEIEQIIAQNNRRASELRDQSIAQGNAYQIYQTKRKSLLDQLERAKQSVAPVAPNKPPAPECFAHEQAITKELADLRAKVAGARLFTAQREANQRRHEELSSSIATLNQQILPLEELENVLRRLPEIEIEQTKSKLSIPGVDVRLVEGVLDVRVNNIPYASLSDGRKIKTDFGWAQKIQSLLNPAPGFYFCDNADLVDRFDGYLPAGAQIFFAVVKKELKELRVVQL